MKFFKRFHPFEIALIFVILAIHLYAALSDAYNMPNTWFKRDDAYYYFKVAQNITEGRGSTFDGINPTNGYHPLWMVVCVPIFALARFDLILPLRVLLMVMAMLNALTAVLIYRLARDNLSQTVALIAAPFWAFNFYIHYVVYEYGLETPLAAFAIVLFVYKLSRFERTWRQGPVHWREVAILGGLGVLVLFSRLDLIFFAVMAGIWVIFRGHFLRFLLPLDMAAIFFSMTVSVALRTGIRSYNTLYADSALEAVLIAFLLKIPFLYFLGCYQAPRNDSLWRSLAGTAVALTAGSVVVVSIYLLMVELGIGKSFPRSAFVLDWGICTLLLLLLRVAAWYFGDRETPSASLSPLEELKQHWKKWLGDGAAYYGVLGGALSLYMLFNLLVFGTTTPVSGQIKRWWGAIGNTVYDYPASNWPAFVGLSENGPYGAWQPLQSIFALIAERLRSLYPGADRGDERYLLAIACCALIILAILIVNAQKVRTRVANLALIPLATGCFFHILSYTTTAYGGAKEWYWVSQMVLLVIGGSVLWDFILQPFQRIKTSQPLLNILALVFGVYLAGRFANFVRTVMPYDYFSPDRPYMEVLPFLEENSPPGSMIGMTGGGNVGYFIHDRTIVNMDGLINSHDYFKAMQNGTAPAYLYEHGMRMVFVNPRLLELPPYYGQFSSYLESFDVYGGKDLMYLWEHPKY